MNSMRVRIVIMMMLALMPAFSALAQYRNDVGYQELEDSENVASMKSHVRYLSSSMLEGRKAGSEGEKLAAEYVTEILKTYGVDVLSPADGEVFGIKTENGDTLTSRNVVAYVPGYDKNLRNQYVVIGVCIHRPGAVKNRVTPLSWPPT